jgi:acyl-CoA synthetase (AMP-forming)/AMP-acid ligase II
VKTMAVLKPDAESIIAFARTRLAGFKAPQSVEFVEALPRRPSASIPNHLPQQLFLHSH